MGDNNGGGSSASGFTLDINQSSTLVDAKTRPSADKTFQSMNLDELDKLLKSGDASNKDKIIEQVTEGVMKQLLADCTDDVTKLSRSQKETGQNDASGSGQSHDVYYVDQL